MQVSAQDKPAAEKKMKDRAEYDLYESIRTGTDPAKKLEALNTWKEKYPQTDYNTERLVFYMGTYQQLQKWPEMMQAAKDLLAADPSNFNALYTLTFYTPVLQNTSADALDTGEKAAQSLLANADKVFAEANKPANVAPDQWTRAKTEAQAIANKTLGWVNMIRKDNAKAEEYFQQSLKLNPNAGEVSYWLGTVILGQRNRERTSEGLYHIARAAAYEGPGALEPNGRKQVNDYLTKSYTAWHGNTTGLDQVKAQAKTAPMPPAGFAITSKADQLKEQIAKEEQLKKENPELALWINIRDQLKVPEGKNYFDTGMKGTGMPKLRGKLVSAKPENKPKELVLAMSDDTTPEVTLTLDTPFTGPAPVGTTLEFNGAMPTSYTADPLMVNMDVERANVKGWPASASGNGATKAKKGATKKGKKR
jgi:tetratricopeptide (TPR) repeat protein